MFYITYDEEANELIVRSLKEIRLDLETTEPTKAIDIDGHEINMDKEKQNFFFAWYAAKHFWETFKDLKKKIELRKNFNRENPEIKAKIEDKTKN